MPKVRDIMTSANLITLTPEMGVIEAAKVLMDHHINGAPVLDSEGTIVGILCREDLISQQKKIPLPSFFVVLDGIIPLSSPRHLEMEMEKIAATTVEHAMTRNPLTVKEDTDVEEIAHIMVDKKIHTIPVTDDDGCLVGIIGKEDILKILLPDQES
ncbi:MAG: CBS domain-containing protein [Desulfomonilia bacterium]|nr:CBS domain-containing protein [Desulfomonilia bacterium]